MTAFVVAIDSSSAVAAVYSSPTTEPTAMIDIVSNVFAVKKEEGGDDTQQVKDRQEPRQKQSTRTQCTRM
jgi:hypothetical protein